MTTTAEILQKARDEHTPGPWSVPHFAMPGVNCRCGYVLVDGHMGAIATVHCSGEGADWEKHGDNPKFEQAVANAHLIAAAPDLLAALKAMLPEANTGDNHCRPSFETCEQARAAIAKAEGA